MDAMSPTDELTALREFFERWQTLQVMLNTARRDGVSKLTQTMLKSQAQRLLDQAKVIKRHE